MKKICLIAFCALLALPANSQRREVDLPDYKFTTVKANPITSVKNQYHSGTCWAFSSTGFIESEIIRINAIKDTLKYPDLSTFFFVSHSYMDRAVKYVRLDGHLNFAAGSEFGDVLQVVKDYGIVPRSAMKGLNYGTSLPEHFEMDAILEAIVSAVVKRPNGTLTPVWPKVVQSALDAYLGPCPDRFTVDGKSYTPATYRDALGFNPDDYVTLTSFTHHPFYQPFVLEVEDNWRWDIAYNVPIEVFMSVLDGAINDGYTAAWGADVTQIGFSRKRGLAILCSKDPVPEDGGIKVEEKDPTQQSRQKEFDNKTITDDHGMQIFGIASDENGKKYYMVKNSWGKQAGYEGIWYATEAFVKGQSMDIVVHKNALPKDLRKKLGL